MKLKRKFRTLLTAALFSMPVLLIAINLAVEAVYNLVTETDVPFQDSIAYPIMHILFFLSFLAAAAAFSRSIHSLLHKLELLDGTIRHLAAAENIPDKLDIKGDDELSELMDSVNLLIERTASKELELQQERELQQEYLNKLRHDINTPLTALRLHLFYLEGEHPGMKFDSLNDGIQYLSDLTHKVNLESPESLDSSYIIKTDIDIHELIGKMVKKWEYLFSRQHIELKFTIQGHAVWISNELWLQRLFDNVFQNVLKHSEAELFQITINDGLVVMRDNGKGFDPDLPNTGLGLKVISGLSEALGITYTLQSDTGGTCFRFQQAQVCTV
ncbi:sensor histidine kinase [Peribacillus sp. SCS-26]|uniref:sensor histidine kinase n=1 Tax=Paraperibacillus marinus TaxID=3115295 RepID=UPI00390673A5